MSVDRHYGVHRPCCVNHNPEWSRNHTIEEYWQSDTLAHLRQNLLKGVRDSSCQSCWQMEDHGHTSMRQAVNSSRSHDISPGQYSIKQVKILTGSTCNLACMMCFDTVSTTYRDTWKNDTTWIMPTAKQVHLEYDEIMDAYIRNNVENLEFVEALGGEPLFNKKFLDLLHYLVQGGHSDKLTLYIITNGSVLTDSMLDLFKKFKKTVFTVSIDGVDNINDYQRWPSRWLQICANVQRLNEHFDISIMPTITALTIIGLPRLLDWCQAHGYVVHNMNLVNHWTQLLPSNLPDNLKMLVSDQFSSFLDGPNNPTNLIQFINRWDNQRGINIRDYMPEWAMVSC